jgi:hypothetical protein
MDVNVPASGRRALERLRDAARTAFGLTLNRR